MDLQEALAAVEQQLEGLQPAEREDVARGAAAGLAVRAPVVPERRSASRFAGQAADAEHVRALAEQGHVVEPARKGGGRPGLARIMAGLAGMAGTKALAEGTFTAGGYLVPVEYSSEVVTLLRARSAVLSMPGVRRLPVARELDINSLSTGATAYYVAENAAIPTSEETFGQGVLLKPKELAALVPVSNKLLRDADNPAVDEIVRNDLAEVLALRADLAFLRGTGGAEPTGIRTQATGTAPSLGANGATPSYDNFMDTVAALRAANAPFLNPGWVFHPRLLNTLEKLKDSTGRYLKDAGLLTYDTQGAGGTLLGYPFRTTTQVPTNLTVGTSTDTTEVYFSSDWQEAWVGENLELELTADSSAAYTTDGGTTWVSAFQNRQTLFRAVTAHDLGLRRPQLFTVLTGVRP